MTLSLSSLNLSLKIKVGDEKYAVLAVVGNTLSFDPPSTFSRDEVTERVSLDFSSVLFLVPTY